MKLASQIHEAGLYTEEGIVPLQGISIKARLSDITSKITIDQRFLNNESKPIEATYCFPLEEGSAVCGFSARIGDRVIEGEIEEREKAFERYDDAIAEGHGAVLLDQEKPTIFIASVGNIMPGTEAVISITYVAELPVADDGIRFCIPTTVSPRYVPAGADPVSADRISPPYALKVPYGLSLNIEITESEELSEVLSPSHKILVSKEPNRWVIMLRDGETCLDRDFILDIILMAAKEPVSLVQEHDNGDRAIMVRLYPEFDQQGVRSLSEIIFLLDCSGSMAGSSIEQAKNVLELCLRSMSMGDYFNIICFGSDFKAMLKQPVEYDEKSFKRALEYVRRIDANLGGTEILPALKYVFEQPASSKGHKRELFILTDGEVFNEEELMRLVKENRKNARIFSFGIGYGPSESLVRGLARESGGMAEFVSPEERIEEKVLRQFARMDTPYVKNLVIDWQGLKVKQAPALIPPVFSGDSFTVFGLVSDGRIPGRIVLSGKVGEEEISWSAPVKQIMKGDLVTTIWAKNYIRDLEGGSFLGRGSRQGQRKADKARQEMVEAGLRYHLMSSVTSFVAVEKRDDVSKAKEAPVYRRVPIQMTKEWHGTASYDLGKFCEDLSTDTGEKSYALMNLSVMQSVKDSPSKLLRSIQKIGAESHIPVLDLLKTQSAAGYFEPTELMSEVSSVQLDYFAELSAQMTGIKPAIDPNHVLATALVLYILKNKYGDAEPLWRKAARKAQDWLDKEAPNVLLHDEELSKEMKNIVHLKA